MAQFAGYFDEEGDVGKINTEEDIKLKTELDIFDE